MLHARRVLAERIAVCLMGGKHKHFGNLHMLRRVGGIQHHVGYVVAVERMDAGIDAVGFRLVATETRDAEIGFHKSRLHVGDAHTGVDKVDAQAVGKSFTAAFVAQYTLPPA